MTQILKTVIICLCLLIINVTSVIAINKPTSVANNKYGIHITDESDIQRAGELVNSSGGDWGYVTFVIREDERDTRRWQNFFDELRRKHLIPIVRIASKQGENGWTKLNPDEIDGWIGFLNSLNWVIQNRYVVVGNEVNLGHEWGGEANPREYADYLNIFSKKLKSSSHDFFIMPAGLDSQAKNNKTDIDEDTYLRQMLTYKKETLDAIDGLASHSYPYKSLENGNDYQTLKHYEWELNILRTFGVEKELPVFITETGWKHDNQNLEIAEINDKLKYAIDYIWNDPKIVAITPFVLNYKSHPFDIFSWLDVNSNPYSFYETYKSESKIIGTPVQIQTGKVISFMLPRFIRTRFNNTYGVMYVENTGQTIWKGYTQVSLILNDKRTVIKPITILSDVEPGHKTLAVYSIK